jgi:hypothetical protein
LQGAAVQEDLVVRLLKRHRIVRGDLIQFFERKGFWIVRELLMIPTADIVDPFPRSCCFRPGAQHQDRLFSRRHAIETEFPEPGVSGAQQMDVVIDKPRSNSPTHKVDPSGVRPGELSHRLVGAYRYDAVPLDSHGLCDGKALIDGNDFPIREDHIRRRLLRTQQHACTYDNQQQNRAAAIHRGEAHLCIT